MTDERSQDFVPAEEFKRTLALYKASLTRESTNIGIHERAGCQVPPIADWAKDHIPRPLRIVSGLAENTNSIICDGSSGLRQQMDVRSCRDAGTTSREAVVRSEGS